MCHARNADTQWVLNGIRADQQWDATTASISQWSRSSRPRSVEHAMAQESGNASSCENTPDDKKLGNLTFTLIFTRSS